MREDARFRITTREKLWEEQNHRCGYCNQVITKEQASLDHIIPVNSTKEPVYNEDSYIVTCKRCNKEKLDYIVFTNLYDRIVYPIITIPYFFHYSYITSNWLKEKRNLK